MARVSFYTLGCKLNYAETSTISREFEDRDFEIVPFGAPADVTVINTCSVTEEADRQCRQIIRRALRLNPGTFIAVTGCYAQLRPDEIAAIEGVDVVLGANEKFRLFEIVQAFEKKERTQIEVSCIDHVTTYGSAYSSGDRTRAFLKVQDGCDYTCSFCTIPFARGKSRSQPLEETLQKAREVADLGYKEVVLSGVNIGLFGQEHGVTLLDLLIGLEKIEKIERYRISSIEPNLLTDEIIEFVAQSQRFQPHFHVPLQSGDNHVLGKMRRRYRREVFADRVNTIKHLIPHACVGADVIVGFPAENEARFDETVCFIEDLPLSYLHVFTYSERANTVAVTELEKIGEPVPKAERSRRNHVLRLLSEKKRHEFYRKHIGTVRPVLWEGAEKNGVMYGFTDNYIKVQRPADSAYEGVIENVFLDSFAPDGTIHTGYADMQVLAN